MKKNLWPIVFFLILGYDFQFTEGSSIRSTSLRSFPAPEGYFPYEEELYILRGEK